MEAPKTVPVHGLSLPIRWRRVIDGNTLDVRFPSGESGTLWIEGFRAPALTTSEGRAAKQALEALLEEMADQPLTAFAPLPKDGMLGTLTPAKCYLYVDDLRVDLWMIEHGHSLV
jgi:endonuclease YncB( thermonuclease family)